MMSEPDAAIKVALRIPGQWSHPRELIERLSDGCRLTPETLILPDATEIEFGAGAVCLAGTFASHTILEWAAVAIGIAVIVQTPLFWREHRINSQNAAHNLGVGATISQVR